MRVRRIVARLAHDMAPTAEAFAATIIVVAALVLTLGGLGWLLGLTFGAQDWEDRYAASIMAVVAVFLVWLVVMCVRDGWQYARDVWRDTGRR